MTAISLLIRPSGSSSVSWLTDHGPPDIGVAVFSGSPIVPSICFLRAAFRNLDLALCRCLSCRAWYDNLDFENSFIAYL
jgi:hypothetical protein